MSYRAPRALLPIMPRELTRQIRSTHFSAVLRATLITPGGHGGPHRAASIGWARG